jgi:hypothetical protein
MSLYLEARIRIRIKVKGRIRVRIKVTSRIRIRIKVMRIRHTGSGPGTFRLSDPDSYKNVSVLSPVDVSVSTLVRSGWLSLPFK